MNDMIRTKLMSKRGETLVESLLGILLIVLTSTIFLGYVAVSRGMISRADNRRAMYEKERTFIEEMTVDEGEDGLVTASEGKILRVSVKKASDTGWKRKEFPVTVYFGDNLAIYQLEDE